MRVRLTIEDDSGRTYHGEVVLDPQGSAKKVQRKEQGPKHASSHPKKPTQALKHLHEKGIFKTEQNLGKVEAELGKMDCNFPKPSLAKALERADFLTRRGTRGNYRWIQRYKPGA
ncbi:MAG TPA: hypothetical protein VH114_04935 [Candidatus Acidoferrum sp.]|jgi:hypothetical protein|nr:hypothetical protein [Candidatus Acidoferrum sp.]